MRCPVSGALAIVSIGLLAAQSYGATTRHWTGGASGNNASTAGNWLEGAPVAGDDIVLDSTTNKPMTWDAAAPAAVASWTQVGYVGTVTVATVYGATGFTNLTIVGNCVISNGGFAHVANSGTEQYRLHVTVGGNLTVGPSGRVDVVGLGFSGGVGQGLTDTKGASHGGHGGREGGWGAAKVDPASTYGSLASPTNLGTSCRSGGGGAIRLLVSGATTIDGVLSAEGAPRASDMHCMGSGGSVWLTTGSLTGTGTVTACGGPTDGGRTCGGGGGRVALIVTNALADFTGFSGFAIAAGGLGAGAGTVYREKPADAGRGDLTVNNNLQWSPSYVATRLGGSAAVTCDFSRITLTHRGNLGLFGADALVLTNTEIVWGGPGPATNCGGISLYGASLALPTSYAWSNGFIRIYTNAGSSLGCQDITIETNAMLIVDQPCTFSNVTARAGACLTHDINWDKEWFRLNMTVISNLTLDVGSSVNVDRRGYNGSCGPGVAQNNVCGASHGGQGGKGAAVAGALTYGSIIAPTNFGSGAVSRSGYDIESGGGAAILAVGGTTTLNGLMTAEGGPRDLNCSAAGGSIYLTTGRLTGSGAIKAKGGTGNTGGGGGRIAVALTNAAASFSEFTGPLSAAGQGAGPGGAGTVYLRAPGQGPNEGTLLVDNAGATAYPTAGVLISTAVTDTVVGDVLIRSNGRVSLALNQSLTVGGMWSNGASFSATTGASVVFAGSANSTSTVYGTSVFYRLNCTTPGKTLRFAAASSNAVQESLTFTGASGSNIVLRSTLDGTQWKVNVAGAAAQLLSYVDVNDSDARPGATVSATYSVDRGNNSNWVFVAAGQTNTWLGTSGAAWGTAGNWSLGRMPSLIDAKAVIPDGCANYPTLDTIRQVNGLDVAPNASLNLNGCNFTAYGDVNCQGSLTATGGEQLTLMGSSVDFAGSGTITPGSSTFVVGGTGAQTANLAGKTFWNVLVTNVTGTVTLNGGCVAKEIRFNGGNSPLSVAFAAGATFATRDFVMQGSQALTNISLRSASPGSAWKLNVTGYSRVIGVDAQDSDASGGKTIHPFYSKDSGSNPNWVFNGPWCTWLGTISANFATAANWSPAATPGADSLILVESGNPMTIGSATTVKGMVLGGGASPVCVQALAPLTVSGDVTVQANATLFLNQPSTVSNDVIVLGGGTLTHTNNVSAELYKLDLTVRSNMFVDAGGAVDVSYKGYDGGQGPGRGGYSGWDTCGASYGGQGAKTAASSGAPPYGSIVAPTNLGSGAQGGNGTLGGGGAVILNVAGVLSFNGQMLANGGARDGNCSASGGTLNLTAGRMTGSGSLRANGGTAGNCGGSGGRIAVVLTNAGASFAEFTGSMLATGQGTAAGGTGTIYLRAPGQATSEGTLVVDNGGLSSSFGALIGTGVTGTAVGDVLIRSKGVLAVDVNQSLTVGGIWSNGATFSATTGAVVAFAGGGSSTSTVYGTSTFYRLTCTTPGKTLKFAAGSSNRVQEALTLTGAAGSNVVLRSTSEGTQWKLNVAASAAQSVSRVDVEDSDARPGAAVSAIASANSGNNSNWVFVVTGETNTWTGANGSAWGHSGNWSLGRMPALTDDKAVIPDGCPSYPVLDAARQVVALDVAAGASLNLNGWDFTAYGNVNWAGGLSATGAERLTLAGGAVDFAGVGAVTAASSTVVIGGAGAQTVNLAGKTFWNLRVTNVSGTVTLTGGCTARELLLDAGTATLSVAFAAGATFTARDVVMQGSATLTNIMLRSASPGSVWKLNVTGYSRVVGVDVQDSDASGGKTIYPASSRNSDRNSNWDFSGAWSTWLGTTSTDFATAANWSPAVAPGADSLILVERTNLMAIGSATTVKGMMLGGETGSVQVQVFAPLTVSGDVTVRTNATLSINQPMTVSNDVMVLAVGTLTHTANPPGQTEQYKLTLAASNLTLDAGSSVNVSYRGFAATYGPGGETADNSCGACYGGQGRPGSTTNDATYGSICAPTNLGSGGYAGNGITAGGGAAILNVAAVTLLNGSILANGGGRDGNNTASGGSVYLTTGRLLGSGPIQAQGGLSTGGMGGGGGRIALVLTDAAASFAEYTGSLTASGLGGGAGGAGTIYLANPGQAAGNRGDVVVNNGGQSATSVCLLPPPLLSVPDELRHARLFITNASTRVKLYAPMSVADVYVYTNAVLDLTTHNLYVYTIRHDLGGGTTNSAGGQIVWIGGVGTLFGVR